MNHEQPPTVGAAVHRRMEHVLSTRTAERGTIAARLEDRLKRGGARIWSLMKRHPSAGITLAAGAGLAAASAVGVGELLVAATAGYAAYQILGEGMRPAEAVKRTIESIEHAECRD
jgi:hypothetical protein